MRSVQISLLLGVALLFPAFLGAAPQNSQNSKTDDASGQPRFDGPAELPRIHMKSALADTPAPGQTRLVKESDNLQAAIDDAKCGDTLKLQAGATFHGLYRFPQKPCDDSHWIIVRTSASDDSLPPEGTRITPCYAGVASLPGRPDFHCPSPQHAMAKIVFDGNGDSGPIFFLDGANHYRFIGLEITRGVPEQHKRHLVQVKDPRQDAADHLVFDRMWLHGNPQDETKGGVGLSGITYAAIVDSYFSDFKCIALKGSCTDAQAVNGGTFFKPGGPYKIENNFLEASGQSVLFGGAGGSTTPTDIEIRRNHLFKPMIWMPGEPGFVAAYTGNPFIVKNNFELKNAQRVLFEDNLLENCWGGFSQTGFSIVLTPANQSGNCPLCRVTDITIRYNKVKNVGSAISIGNIPGKFDPSSGGERYSIHDLLVEDIRGESFKGFGNFTTVISVAPLLKDVRIDHVTAFPSRAVMTVINNRGEKVPGFSITNSIFSAGEAEMRGAGGGPQNCATQKDRDPVSVLNQCFANPVVSNNLIIGADKKWPDHNFTVKNADSAGLWKKETATGTDYRICREKGEAPSCSKPSLAVGAGTDGKDLGADTEKIEQAIAGVI